MGLLIAGVVTVGLALLVLLLVAVIPREPTGVSRSLLLLEHRIDPSSVPRHQLPASERFIAPLLRRTQRLGAGLSPSGTYESLGRRLDRAGNPGSWTPDRILGAKGAGLVLGLLLGMLIIGPSASGVVLSLGLAVMLFFAPDLALAAYVAGPRVGAFVYNFVHIYGFGLLLLMLGSLTGHSLLLQLGALWFAHSGFDRMLGRGLKTSEGFRFTHLGQIGRDR